MDMFIAPVIVTVIILAVYYAQYTMALSMGCVRMRSAD